MARIEIRGVIVPSDYDNGWYQGYIDKGVITPESRVRSAIAASDKTKPMEVYINSPGGDVFAGFEMINTIKGWMAEAKQSAHIIIGAQAASMAAGISVLSGAKVSVHKNSKLMFHGAWGGTIGGAGAHQDTATLLNQINADVKTKLISVHNVPVETVDEWFSEGRMGWITANDAIKYGIASEIIDADAAPVTFETADVTAMLANGLDIAAYAKGESTESTTDEGKTDEGNESAGESAKDEVGNADETATDDAAKTGEGNGNDAEDSNESIIAARVEILLGERLEAHVAELNQLKAHADNQAKLITAQQSEKDKAIAARAKDKTHFEQLLAESQEALKQANARMTKLTLGSLSFSASIESWPEALKACDGDYAKARKQYPDAYQSYMNHNNRK
jgi:ATP-dependent protease ClpP protease subunit